LWDEFHHVLATVIAEIAEYGPVWAPQAAISWAVVPPNPPFVKLSEGDDVAGKRGAVRHVCEGDDPWPFWSLDRDVNCPIALNLNRVLACPHAIAWTGRSGEPLEAVLVVEDVDI
jgi:hypothetical protein